MKQAPDDTGGPADPRRGWAPKNSEGTTDNERSFAVSAVSSAARDGSDAEAA